MMKRSVSMFATAVLSCVSVALVGVGTPHADALVLPAWSNDIEISNNPPTSSASQLAVDASEDGSVVAAIWRTESGGRSHVAVGWTDGIALNWSNPVVLFSNASSGSFYHAISVSGDGRTVFAVWTEQSGEGVGGRLNDSTYAIGAVSVDPTTNIPSVTWTNATQLAVNNHQDYPAIDSNYDGTKALIVDMSTGISALQPSAHVLTVNVAQTPRSATVKGPVQISTIGTTYTPSSSYQAIWRPTPKISQDGKRAVVAWWNPTATRTDLGQITVGRIEASLGNLDESTMFWSAVSGGSEWAGRTILSSLEANSYSMPAVDINDAGTRAVVAWPGTTNGTSHYVAARTANITSATNGTWNAETKLIENLVLPTTYVRANLDSDGGRAFVSWNTGPTFTDRGSTYATFGTLGSNAIATWNAPAIVQTGNSFYGVNSAAMSRDGATAIAIPLTINSGTRSLESNATNIELSNNSLITDWESSLVNVTSDIGTSAMAQFGSTISKDGSIVTVIWTGANKVLSRVLQLRTTTDPSASPNPSEGGQTDSSQTEQSPASESNTAATTLPELTPANTTIPGLTLTDTTVYTQAPRQVANGSAIMVLSASQTKTHRVISRTPNVCMPTDNDIVFLNEGKCAASVLSRRTGRIIRRLSTTVTSKNIAELGVGNQTATMTPIYFANGSDRLSRTARRQIQKVKEMGNSFGSIVVVGHTGIMLGDTQENYLLSRSRATKTIREMRRAKIDGAYFAWAMGARDPAVNSTRRSDQKLNRRVNIVLVP